MATGTSESMKKISRKVLRTIELPVPSLDEQRRIAAQLVRVRDAIVALDEEQARLQKLRAEMLEGLLTGELIAREPAEAAAL